MFYNIEFGHFYTNTFTITCQCPPDPLCLGSTTLVFFLPHLFITSYISHDAWHVGTWFHQIMWDGQRIMVMVPSKDDPYFTPPKDDPPVAFEGKHALYCLMLSMYL